MKLLPLLLFLFVISIVAQAQNPVFTLNDASTYPAAQSGIGLGNTTSYDTYQLKNLFVNNPAMQPQMVRNIKTAASGSTTTLVTSGDYDGIAANGYVGWTLYFAAHGGQGSTPGTGAGGVTGQSAIVTANTANNSGTGTTTFTFAALSAAVAINDTAYLISPSNQTTSGFGHTGFGWDANTTGAGTVTVDTVDVPPTLNTFPSPIQCIKLTNASGTDTSQLAAYMDMGSSLNYVFSGGYHESIMVKVLSGTPTLTMFGNRQTSGGFSWSNAVSPTGTWTTYTTTFTGTETTSSTSGNVYMGFTLSGTGSVCVVGAQLTADSDNNPTPWRNQVITDLQTMKVGEIRYNASGVQGTTLLNWITPMAYRQPSYLFAATGTTNGVAVQTGLHEFLVLAQYLNLPRVAIVVPNTWNATDMSNFIDYLAGGSGTTYGAYRIALGQTAAWSTVFSKIILEYGNETWNGTFNGSYVPQYSVSSTAYWNYVELATAACGSAKANGNWNSSVMKCSASIQTASGSNQSGYFTSFDTSHNVDIVNANGYGQFNVTSCTTPALFRSPNTEAWAHANDASDPTGLYQTAAATLPVYIYEYNNSTNAGSCTQAQLTGYAGGEAYGLTHILETLYLNKKWGITDFNFWSLNQRYISITTSGGTSNLEEFGVKTGPGGALNNMRPAGYAIGLMNGAINGGTGIAVTETNTPTYSPAAENGANAETNVPYLHGFCFKNGTGRGCVVVNTDQSNSYTFTIAGTNPPAGTVTKVIYSSTNVTDNNESSLVVTNSTSTVTNPTSFSVAAHSAIAVQWQTGAPSVGVFTGILGGTTHVQ